MFNDTKRVHGNWRANHSRYHESGKATADLSVLEKNPSDSEGFLCAHFHNDLIYKDLLT